MTHDDIIVNFTENGKKVPEIKLSVKLPESFNPEKVTLRTTEADRCNLKFEKASDRVGIAVPGNIFSGYALVTIE